MKPLPKSNWQNRLFQGVTQMLQQPNGDLESINQLAKQTLSPRGLKLQVEHLSKYDYCKVALRERPVLGTIDLDALNCLPKNTLGYHYVQFMQGNQLEPLTAHQTTHQYNFISSHLLETHDIWHVIINADIDICGEMKLAAFYAAQLKTSGLWYALMAKNLLKSIIYNIEDSSRYMDAIATGWMMGRQAKPLFGINWQECWMTPLEEVRSTFNVMAMGNSQGSLP